MLRSALLTLALIATAVADGRAVADGLEDALRLLPERDIHAIAAVDRVKRTSEEVVTLLEGMDRGDMLLGVRPVDQLKSALGVTVAVDDRRSALLAVVDGDDGPDAIFVIPVTDAAAFLRDNFKPAPDGDGAYLTRGGARLWARPLDGFVVISIRQPLDGYRPRGDAALDWLAERLPGGAATLAEGDLGVVVLDLKGVVRAASVLLADDVEVPIEDPLQDELAQRFRMWFESFERGDATAFHLTFDFDPLALIMRTRLTLTSLDGLPPAKPASGRPFDRLPGGPYMLAVSADLDAWRRPQLRTFVEPLEQLPMFAGWVGEDGRAPGDRAQLAVYPSAAGLAGGVMNDSFLIVEIDDAGAAATALRDQLGTFAAAEALGDFELHWDDGHVVETVGTVTSYELEVERWADAAVPALSTSFTTVFGQMGWRGFVAPTDGGLAVTFSQRPSVLRKALAHEPASRLLADDPAIRSMRSWIPATAELQVFARPGPAGALLAELPLPIPVRIEPGLPPVGFALWTTDGGIETMTVCPAPVLATILDGASRMQTLFADPGGP